jgi:hypothetical protein
VDGGSGVSRALDSVGDQVEAEASRLIDLPGSDRDYDLGRLTRSLGMWSIAIRRMAESGPASLRSSERRFRDHPEFGSPDLDPLASHRALLDVVSFLTAGDMVLDDFAAMQLARWSLGAGLIPWRTFTRRLDSGDRRGAVLLPSGRFLDLVLREARARIVAHRLRSHALSNGWAPDGTFDVAMIGMGDSAQAADDLRTILREVDFDPGPNLGYPFLVDLIIDRATVLDAPQRRRVTEAFALGGYNSTHPALIVGALVGGVTSTIREAVPK